MAELFCELKDLVECAEVVLTAAWADWEFAQPGIDVAGEEFGGRAIEAGGDDVESLCEVSAPGGACAILAGALDELGGELWDGEDGVFGVKEIEVLGLLGDGYAAELMFCGGPDDEGGFVEGKATVEDVFANEEEFLAIGMGELVPIRDAAAEGLHFFAEDGFGVGTLGAVGALEGLMGAEAPLGGEAMAVAIGIKAEDGAGEFDGGAELGKIAGSVPDWSLGNGKNFNHGLHGFHGWEAREAIFSMSV